MAFSGKFKELVQKRLANKSQSRTPLLHKGINAFLAGDIETGKSALRDYIKSTVGFEKLGKVLGAQPKSLIRMFGPSGNPQARNLFGIIGYLQKQAGVEPPISTSLQSLMQRGCDFLGSPLAIMGGAMTWVSERHLVAAISNAGGFGILASGSMPPDLLRKEIQGTKALTNKPFGVNLITMHPQLDDLIDVCLAEKISHIVLAGGLPSAPSVKRVKDGGAKLICFTPTAALGKKLVRMGADALVIEGMEAGGHIGPVSTSVLAQEILPAIREVPIFVAGGIGRGEAILAYLEMGAAGVQLGTRFVCATECIAHQNFKRAFINAAARDAIPSIQIDPRFPVIPVRAVVNEGSKRFMDKQREVIGRFDSGELTKEAAQLEIEHFWAGALRRAVVDGDVTTGSLMAGQSVGMVAKEQPVTEILTELMQQAETALKQRL